MGVTASIQKYPEAAATPYTVQTSTFTPTVYNITNVTWNAAYIEYTTSVAHGFAVYQYVYVTGVRLTASTGSPGVNGEFQITAVPTTTTFRVPVSGTALTYSAGTGVVSVSLGSSTAGIKYVNNTWFYLTATNGSILYSTDGTTWQYSNVSGIFGDRINDIAYGNGIYVLVPNYSNTIYTSTNLTTWTARTLASFNSGNFAYFSSALGLFVIGGGTYNTVAEIYTSSDGITWTARTPAGTTSWAQSIDFDGTRYIIASVQEYYYSTNLTSWTVRTLNVSAYRPPAGRIYWDSIRSLWHWQITSTGNGWALTGSDMTTVNLITTANDNPYWREATPSNGSIAAGTQNNTDFVEYFFYNNVTGKRYTLYPNSAQGGVTIIENDSTSVAKWDNGTYGVTSYRGKNTYNVVIPGFPALGTTNAPGTGWSTTLNGGASKDTSNKFMFVWRGGTGTYAQQPMFALVTLT